MARKPGGTTQKTTLAERAYYEIKRAILLGEIIEGTFLTEIDICRRFRIGRTPFREACNRLHNERILEVVPHRGYYVPEISFRSVQDLFETRLVLESCVAELAALRALPNQIRELESIERQLLSQTESSSDFDAVVKGNSEFHYCLAKMTQNKELIMLSRSILDRTERLSYLEYRRAGWNRKLTRILHGPILRAIRDHDPNAARKAVLNDIGQAQVITTSIFPGTKFETQLPQGRL